MSSSQWHLLIVKAIGMLQLSYVMHLYQDLWMLILLYSFKCVGAFDQYPFYIQNEPASVSKVSYCHDVTASQDL